MAKHITPPLKGRPITARFLGDIARNQNEQLARVRRPRSINGGEQDEGDTIQGERGPPGLQGVPGEPGAGLELFEAWTENSRNTTTVRIESADDPSIFVDIERIDNITFNRPGGGSITLYLDD